MVERITICHAQDADEQTIFAQIPGIEMVKASDYAALEARCRELEKECDDADFMDARIADLERQLSQYKEAFHKAFNQFENITVSDTLAVVKERAHQMIGWAYAVLPDYALETKTVVCGVCNVPMTEHEPGKWHHTGECSETETKVNHEVMQGEAGWVWRQSCKCERCRQVYEQIAADQQMQDHAERLRLEQGIRSGSATDPSTLNRGVDHGKK